MIVVKNSIIIGAQLPPAQLLPAQLCGQNYFNSKKSLRLSKYSKKSLAVAPLLLYLKDSYLSSFRMSSVKEAQRTEKNSNSFRDPNKFSEVKAITLRLASPDTIRRWAETLLPDGKTLGIVYNANTLHHNTLKPLKGGLFCERIFGPTKDFQCACGIQKQKPLIRTNLSKNFCSKCDVEYTWSLKRRYQLGYIRLVSPVTHLWYVKESPSFIAVMLDMKRKILDSIIYCSNTLTIDSCWKPGMQTLYYFGQPIVKELNTSLSFNTRKKRGNLFFKNQKEKLAVCTKYDLWWRFGNLSKQKSSINVTDRLDLKRFKSYYNFFFSLYFKDFLVWISQKTHSIDHTLKNFSVDPPFNSYSTIFNETSVFFKRIKNTFNKKEVLYSKKIGNLFLKLKERKQKELHISNSLYSPSAQRNTRSYPAVLADFFIKKELLKKNEVFLNMKLFLFMREKVQKKPKKDYSWRDFWKFSYSLCIRFLCPFYGVYSFKKRENSKFEKNEELFRSFYELKKNKLFLSTLNKKSLIQTDKKKFHFFFPPNFFPAFSPNFSPFFLLKNGSSDFVTYTSFLKNYFYSVKKKKSVKNRNNLTKFSNSYFLNIVSFSLFIYVIMYFFNYGHSEKIYNNGNDSLKLYDKYSIKTIKKNKTKWTLAAYKIQRKNLLFVLIKKIKDVSQYWRLFGQLLKTKHLLAKNCFILEKNYTLIKTELFDKKKGSSLPNPRLGRYISGKINIYIYFNKLYKIFLRYFSLSSSFSLGSNFVGNYFRLIKNIKADEKLKFSFSKIQKNLKFSNSPTNYFYLDEQSYNQRIEKNKFFVNHGKKFAVLYEKTSFWYREQFLFDKKFLNYKNSYSSLFLNQYGFFNCDRLLDFLFVEKFFLIIKFFLKFSKLNKNRKIKKSKVLKKSHSQIKTLILKKKGININLILKILFKRNFLFAALLKLFQKLDLLKKKNRNNYYHSNVTVNNDSSANKNLHSFFVFPSLYSRNITLNNKHLLKSEFFGPFFDKVLGKKLLKKQSTTLFPVGCYEVDAIFLVLLKFKNTLLKTLFHRKLLSSFVYKGLFYLSNFRIDKLKKNSIQKDALNLLVLDQLFGGNPKLEQLKKNKHFLTKNMNKIRYIFRYLLQFKSFVEQKYSGDYLLKLQNKWKKEDSLNIQHKKEFPTISYSERIGFENNKLSNIRPSVIMANPSGVTLSRQSIFSAISCHFLQKKNRVQKITKFSNFYINKIFFINSKISHLVHLKNRFALSVNKPIYSSFYFTNLLIGLFQKNFYIKLLENYPFFYSFSHSFIKKKGKNKFKLEQEQSSGLFSFFWNISKINQNFTVKTYLLKEFKVNSRDLLLNKNFVYKNFKIKSGGRQFKKALNFRFYSLIYDLSLNSFIGISNNSVLKRFNSNFILDSALDTLQKNGSKESKMTNILYNNIYVLSHRYFWSAEEDLKTFLNYITVPSNPNDIPIPKYAHRLVKFNLFRDPPPVLGGGLIQKLLAEFNPNESVKIIMQIENQLKKVSILLKYCTDFIEARNLRLKRNYMLRRLKFIRSGSYKFTEDFLLKKNEPIEKTTRGSSQLVSPFVKQLMAFNNISKNVKKQKQNIDNKILWSSSTPFLKKGSEKGIKKRPGNSLKINNLRSILKESRPEWMVLSLLPVLPPDLRPIIQIGNGICSSDLNRLYQKVIYRNERLKRFLKDSTSTNSPQMKFAYRLLQEAVDNLIDNGKGKGNVETSSQGVPLKSLTELLKGKKGRFRQNLLGKRVDYSGRSVIVVGPRLHLHECGLPKDMAIELFMPFLIQKIFQSGRASTILGAKKILQNDHNSTWEFLNLVMRENPVLLNRAPTLHRFGFQAFQPRLVEGKAILLHPLVCPAFNADFDGDQMAVHVPITVEAKVEAWKIMLARNHLLSSSTGEAMLVPSQDMVLGCYYLTAKNPKFYDTTGSSVPSLNMTSGIAKTTNVNYKRNIFFMGPTLLFNSIDDVLRAYESQKISLHSIIWLKWNNPYETHERSHRLLELQINRNGKIFQIFNVYSRCLSPKREQINNFIQTTPGRVMFFSFLENTL